MTTLRRILLLSFVIISSAAGAAEPLEKWVYYPVNLAVDANVDALVAMCRRAGVAGYDTLLISDSKFSRLADMAPSYFANIQRVKDAASANHLTVIPAVFPIGYSNDILSRDPNLAEGLPVNDALFVVGDDAVARLVADPAVTLRGGDMSDLSRWEWKDPIVTADDGAALVHDPAGANARLVQTLTVSPFRQYHISVRIKTQDFIGSPRIAVLTDTTPSSLQFTDIISAKTQAWTVHHVVFNSLANAKVRIYFGCWGAQSGSLWWDDATIDEVGLLNLVRRAGAPLSVRRDGGPILSEGRDFDAIVDPRMGVVPWAGGYDVWHEPPAITTHGLPAGTRLRVSYYHAITVGDGQVMICPSEPKTIACLREQAQRVHAAWGAPGYFMSHDEIRVLGWDLACTQRHLTPGAILADNVDVCSRILREVAPGAKMYVWSDMFDPNHNAHADYYLVNGDLAGSWKGLTPDVRVMAWNLGVSKASLQFFSGLGLRTLMAGFYDAQPDNADAWLREAAGIPGVEGIMYTTWTNDFSHLESFAQQADAAHYARTPMPAQTQTPAPSGSSPVHP